MHTTETQKSAGLEGKERLFVKRSTGAKVFERTTQTYTLQCHYMCKYWNRHWTHNKAFMKSNEKMEGWKAVGRKSQLTPRDAKEKKKAPRDATGQTK